MDNLERPIYSIQAVSKLVGVPSATLRTWEERYGVVAPERTPSGHRLYSRQQVEQLQFLKGRIDEGLSAADAHRVLQEHMDTDQSLTEQTQPRPLVVLIADRDRFAADIQEYFLKTEGFEVQVALSDETALQAFVDHVPSVVIVDLLMDGGAGFELCRRFKEAGARAVVAVSTLEARDEALEVGADAFLVKPLGALELISTIKDLLGASAFLRARA